MAIIDWTPPEWACNCFPQTQPGEEIVALEDLVATLHAHVDTATEADTTAICAVLHVGHILVTLQGPDGLWPAVLNLRNGKPAAEGRSAAPLDLFYRLNSLLQSTEFDLPCRRAEAGRAVLQK